MKKIYRLLWLALCAGAAVVLLCAAAGAVDLSQPCAVTVQAGGPDFAEDLAQADVVIDLYEIAGAYETEGYDALSWQFIAPYDELTIGDTMDADAWRSLAQSAAQIALTDGVPVVTGAPAGTRVEAMNDGTPLPPGLYLVIARGAQVEDYIVRGTDEDGSETLSTTAWSPEYVYSYLPELISLPSREDVVLSEDGDEESQPGDWIYDVTAALKPSRDPRNGFIRIDKTLLRYDSSETPMFVFDVEAELDGEVVFSDVLPMTFLSAGTKSITLEMPVGAVVTVTEQYSGASYRLVTEAEQTVTVTAEEIAAVSFTNDYTPSSSVGHGISNHFTYDGETWQWIQSDGDE